MQTLETGFFHAAQFPRDSSKLLHVSVSIGGLLATCINFLEKYIQVLCPFFFFFLFFIAEQYSTGASLEAQPVKNLPTRQDTPVQFLGQEDLLEKG